MLLSYSFIISTIKKLVYQFFKHFSIYLAAYELGEGWCLRNTFIFPPITIITDTDDECNYFFNLKLT